MDDQEKTEERSVTVDSVMDRMASMFEQKLEEHDAQTAEKLDAWVDGLSKERSHTPPVQKRGRLADAPVRGDVIDVETFQVRADGRDILYRRMEESRSSIQIQEFRAARNPKMDELAKAWCKACHDRNIGERVRLHDEMNDLYARTLLSGTPDPNSGLGDGPGADLLPLPLSNQLILERDRTAKMRSLCNVFPMSSETVRIPVLPTVTASTRAENQAFADNTPPSDSALLAATDLGVMFSAGRNFLEDSAFNMANQLTVVAGQAIGAEEDVQICTSTGTGSDITEGLDGATITDIPETTLNSIGYQDIVNLYYGLPEQYRRNARFFAEGTTLNEVMNIVDSAGRPIFTPITEPLRPVTDLDPAAVGVLFGKPVYEVPVADDVIYFGDPMWYAVGDRVGIRVDVERAIETGQRTWVIDQRFDGRVIPTGVVGTNNAWRKVVY